ncbi:macrolide ABC transporter ATP-binding protein [Candidatus Epulonipiscium fishelsonii]|uniref:Macrolide ABC transporter ATP-binding protein n=1 Tax=Candidatus Epulonipiscium fishelsonii TaxID=77094 RepID=A0ACC8X9Y0_9FIRM|nr:macrolide ABC transporter ATP-binding protein [Epulopiscium sp. SCG-B11WGA-EpuloA1]ONI39334.1 macrolide ABC transporter ATP-binding protein [Epulopiscium sp. SCG-B05WGA-EpuloA1]
MLPIVRVTNLYKIYKMGDEVVNALNGVSLEVQKGEVCCLFGTSGSGKSTLLNMIAGLEKCTKGEVYIGSSPIHKMNEEQVTKFRQLHVGFIFQSYNLISSLTAMENVSLPLIFQEIPKRERDKRAKEMLEAVGLGQRLHHKPNEMSGGQQQRVSIARAFVNHPAILFADEPTGNLDTTTTIEIMDMMTSMAKKYNQTIIIVSHDLETADYSDKIVTMQNGLIKSVKLNTSKFA